MLFVRNEIDHGKEFDWGRISKEYAKYRDIYPDIFYQKIVDLGLCTSGQKVLDLGTGTGVLPRNMYRYGAKFTGVDISANQIEQAKKLSHASGMDIDYMVSSAECIDFPSEMFDVVTACQCFMYFDKEIVVPKIHSLLKENGHFCILFMDWLPEESEIAQHSEELVLKYNPSWTGGGMRRHSIHTPEWSKELYTVENAITYDLDLTFTRDSWHGRIKACRGIGASCLSEKEIEQFEKEHKQYLSSQPETFVIPHYVSILNLRKKNQSFLKSRN